ncbi:hypothetical protein MMC22_006489 [Lobaria immixta]|nr:hypothetical protein [Lobaria immixta]
MTHPTPEGQELSAKAKKKRAGRARRAAAKDPMEERRGEFEREIERRRVEVAELRAKVFQGYEREATELRRILAVAAPVPAVTTSNAPPPVLSTSTMRPGEAVVLVSTGANGISTSIKAWDALAKRYDYLTIYIALGVEPHLLRYRQHYPTEDILDGGWLQELWSPDRCWAIHSVPRLLSGWYNRLFDNHYTSISI